MSALIRGALISGMRSISPTSFVAVWYNRSGFDPDSMIEIARPVPPPPFCDWK